MTDLPPFRIDPSGGWKAWLRLRRGLVQFPGKHPGVRRVLRIPKRAAHPLFWLRQQGRDQVYRNLCRELREDPVVAVPEFGGEFSIDVRSDVFRRLLMNGQYEPHLAACCRRCVVSGRDAIDVGANVGFYSVLLARCLSPGRRVLAVEPSPEAIARLGQNIRRNGVQESVLVHDGAASNEDGPCALATVEGRSEYSTLGPLVHPSVSTAQGRTVRVEGTRLDELVRRSALDPGFIKIDVEGAELRVLGGATRVLTEMRPSVLLEVHRYLLEEAGGSADDVLRLLERHRYRFFDPESSRGPAVWKDCFAVLCLPEERDLQSAKREGCPGRSRP